jgi:hypothetical protein
MICPHCRVAFHENEEKTFIGEDVDGGWEVVSAECAACGRLVLSLENGVPARDQFGRYAKLIKINSRWLFRPRGMSRQPLPAQVPREFAQDYEESSTVLQDSAQASAALSRRCLQHVLREVMKAKPSDLFSEIQEVIDGGTLPSQLTEVIDAVRVIGNFAAHPMKSKNSGEVLPVEPGEAEWNLDVLDALFDFLFVQPDKIAQRKAAPNQKLQAAGKPPLK